MAAVSALSEGLFNYLKPADVAKLGEAYRFSEAAHAGQTRQSGEPYISHPLAVTEILAGWHMDSQALTAALLHDVMPRTRRPRTSARCCSRWPATCASS